MMVVRQALRQPVGRLLRRSAVTSVRSHVRAALVAPLRRPSPAHTLPTNITFHRRGYAASTMKFAQSSLSESQYHALSDQCLDALTDSLEQLVEEYDGPDADSFEAEYSSGVLNLRLGPHGTYVINKQPPNKQIWLSSPRSGPKRFDYDAKQQAWFMLKEGEESNLRDLLNTELSDIFGRSIEVDIGA